MNHSDCIISKLIEDLEVRHQCVCTDPAPVPFNVPMAYCLNWTISGSLRGIHIKNELGLAEETRALPVKGRQTRLGPPS